MGESINRFKSGVTIPEANQAADPFHNVLTALNETADLEDGERRPRANENASVADPFHVLK